jgi:ATP-dependent Lon protease
MSSSHAHAAGAHPHSPTTSDLRQVRFENVMLQSEKQFLTQAVAAGPSTSARANTARHSADSVEVRLLRAYLTACELNNNEARAAVEAQMKARVQETQRKVDTLRELLETVQKDVEEVLQASGGWGHIQNV